MWGVLGCRRANDPPAFDCIWTVVLAGSGPLEKAIKPCEGFKGLFLAVVVVIRNLCGGGIWGGKGVVVALAESVLERWFRDRAGRMLNGMRELVERPIERDMEATRQTGVVLLRPCRGEAGYGRKRGAGEAEPRSSRGSFGRLLRGGSEGIGVDGLVFEIGFLEREGGSRKVEPRNLRDGQIPDFRNERGVENRDKKKRDEIRKN